MLLEHLRINKGLSDLIWLQYHRWPLGAQLTHTALWLTFDLYVQDQVCNDVAKRLRLLEDSWRSGRLSLPVRRRMDALSLGNLSDYTPTCGLPEHLSV